MGNLIKEKRSSGPGQDTSYSPTALESPSNGDIIDRFRRQFSSAMSRGYDSEDSKHAIAIAAAAFAIQSFGEKKDSTAKLPQSNKFKKLFSNKEGKNPGETSMRKSMEQDYKALERPYSASKPGGQSSTKPTTTADSWKKVEKYVKLKSFLAWANEKKMKAKHKVEKKKHDLEVGRAKSM